MSEADEYKRNVNLIDYARHCGYVVDDKESTPRGNPTNWVLRRHSDDGKLLARHTGECWIYRDMRAPANRGTIIDFVQKEKGYSKGHGTSGFGLVMKDLRGFCGGAPPPPPAPTRAEIPPKIDRSAVSRLWEAASTVAAPEYLVRDRQIPAAVLTGRLFAGTFRQDSRNNVVFPTYDREGLRGLELRNRRGFCVQWPAGDTKGIWLSNSPAETRQLVIAESAIDALSYAALFRPAGTRFVATGGGLSKAGGEYLRQIAAGLPLGHGQVVLAIDNDKGGADVAKMIRQYLPEGSRWREHPPSGAKDWNDALKNDLALGR